ncbi:hypothetical protein ACFO3O_03385 [Dokdonia ponticola]|uniref:Uncharacterized protein n=1 Tax=Dokdonia ponticola TaxID=2041041 RepID=A0ABV9HRZ0_9FLAO
MRTIFFYVLLLCMLTSCIEDKPKTIEPPTPPETTMEVPEIPEVPEVHETDTIPEPPPPPPVVKAKPKPAPKKKKVVNKKPEDYKSLIFNVQLGINPDRKNWVLFKNGTYLIFPNNTAERDAIRAAKKLMSNYKKGALSTQKSSFAKGWIAATNTGIYNYIDRASFGKGIPKQENILKKGLDNIMKDAKELEIIYINQPK